MAVSLRRAARAYQCAAVVVQHPRVGLCKPGGHDQRAGVPAFVERREERRPLAEPEETSVSPGSSPSEHRRFFCPFGFCGSGGAGAFTNVPPGSRVMIVCTVFAHDFGAQQRDTAVGGDAGAPR